VEQLPPFGIDFTLDAANCDAARLRAQAQARKAQAVANRLVLFWRVSSARLPVAGPMLGLLAGAENLSVLGRWRLAMKRPLAPLMITMVALHKTATGDGCRGVDLTLSQRRFPNLLDRLVGVTTESGAVSVSCESGRAIGDRRRSSGAQTGK